VPWKEFEVNIYKVEDAAFVCDEIPDLRHDANALQDIEHEDPLWAKCLTTLRHFGIRHPQHVGRVWISLEKFMQVYSPANQEIDMDIDTIWSRVKMSTRTIHKVNDDRLRSFRDLVSFDTATVVFTALRDAQYKRRYYLAGHVYQPFTHPKGQPRY
jgi:hypothetical protein